ncbi:16S rRNA m(2)G 1207 methyltransferase [Micromonospora sp. M71_S20]|uniref:class I SAM-dependent methyltransferase n=1 Tax=Micromonospora sp. M71_S20 TaxID=592872 RepID=UPI000EB44482|nr:methyltransferase [Micromonospora sp. M71_S20]RLK13818.1 16S rRNA m(2)G 1207 methyltransferase [Micromonospora sp. M71_S20]
MTGEHYFTAEPTTAASPREVEFSVAGRDYALASSAGVFSAARLDPGTAVLLRKAELPSAGTTGALLDLGCGFGPITCVLASSAPSATVWAVDVNERARELTAANAARVGAADRVRVAAPDDVPADLTLAEIWSNPPIHVGKDELHGILLRWLPRLAPNGVAWLVVARYLGGDSLQRWLVEQGWQVGRHASQKGYRVLRVTR